MNRLEQFAGAYGVRLEGRIVVERLDGQRDRPIVGPSHGSRLGRPHPEFLARHAVYRFHF